MCKENYKREEIKEEKSHFKEIRELQLQRRKDQLLEIVLMCFIWT